MSDLPPEWEAIANDPVQFGGNRREAVERCYALASKPKRELTDAEIVAIADKTAMWDRVERARAIEAAIWAKQREPETVTFRAARNTVNGSIGVFPLKPNGDVDNKYFHSERWEWLEPAQEIEVTL